jgi:hypothetical protein
MNSMNKLLLITASIILTLNGNAQLVFNSSVQTLDESGYEYSVGNLNNDTFPDIYISSHFNQPGDPGRIWINNGDGNFTASQSIGHEQLTHRVAFADLDNDGDLDLFLANDASYSGNVTYAKGCPNEVWFNDGEGNFENSGQLLGFEPSNKVTLTDVDNDTDIDAVIGNYHPGDDLTWSKFKPDEIWLNDGNGTFSLNQSFGFGMGYPLMMDMDNDDDLDAIDQDTLWLNNGSGLFSKSLSVFNFGDKVNAFQFGDLDNDGDEDVFIGMWDAPAEVWLNDGAGNFENSNQKLGNLKCNNITLLDIDNDNDLDAFTDNNGGHCKLWINQGGKQNDKLGLFQDSNIELPEGNGILCDFNKDGKQDAIIGNKVWINEYEITSTQLNIENINARIFPNPTTVTTTLIFGSIINQATAEFFNLKGSLIFSATYKETPTATIDLTDYPTGIYILKVIADGEAFQEKVIKEW